MLPTGIQTVLVSGECEVDLVCRELRLAGSPVPIGGRAFEIIEVLAQSAGDLVTKDDLMRRVWPGAIVMENTLRVHTAAVRKALGAYRSLLKTESGRGYRLLGSWTARHQDAARRPRGLQQIGAGAGSPRDNIPVSITRLVGRATSVQRLKDLVSAYRVVTLTGPGGIGKTALALKVARRVLSEFSDGGWLVELASVSDPFLVPSALAGVLDLNVSGQQITAEATARAIGERNLLLVLDNCEHLIDAVANLAETLLQSCPRITIMATSREVMRTAGEFVYRVSPLDLPVAEDGPDDILRRSAAELLVVRIKELDSRFAPDPHNLSSVAAICRQLDGIPLAIEFAAARAATIGIHTVAAGLSDRFALLTSGRRTALPRHKTLRATLDWSYDLLPETERSLLRRLAVFPGGFTADAAAAVMKDVIPDPLTVMDAIANLVAKSLIALRSDTNSRWYMLEIVRAYALEKLAQRGEYSAASLNHAEYFRDLIVPMSASSTYLLSADDLVRCDRELDNVRAALDWSFSPDGDAAIGATLTAAFAPVWTQTLSRGLDNPLNTRTLSLFDECRDRVQKVLLRHGLDLGLSAALERRMFTAYSQALAATVAPLEESLVAFRRAQQLSEGIDDVELQVHLRWCQWSSEMNYGGYRTSLATARSIKAIAHRGVDAATRLMGDRYLGTSLLYAGRLHEARDHLQRVVDDYVAPIDRRHITLFQHDQQLLASSKLALIQCLSGHMDRASEQARLILNEPHVSGSGFSFCWVLQDCQCRVATISGDLPAAETAITAISDCATRIDSPIWKMIATAWQGKLLVDRGAFAEGIAVLTRALEQGDRSGWRFCQAEFLGYLAQGLAGLGRLDEASDTIKRAIARAEQSGEYLYHAEHIRMMAELLLRRSADTHAPEAEDCFRTAGEMARDQGAMLWELRIATSFARLRVTQGRHDEARLILAPVYGRFTEGFATTDLRVAKALLDGPLP